MDEDTFNAAIAGTDAQRDVNVRQVANGFIVSGNTRYVIAATQSVKLAQTVEGVASDHTAAAAMATNYLANGTFTA